MSVVNLTAPMIALTGWSWALYCVDRQVATTEGGYVPKHAPGRYVRNDPSGGGQWRFWAMIILAVVVAVGVLILMNADRIG